MSRQAKKTQFKAIIEQDEDGFFVATVPALPGCHTQAKTMKELWKRVEEAIQLCLDVAEHDPTYRKQIREFGYEPSFVGLQMVTV